MTVKIEKMPDEAIILCTYDGSLTVDDLHNIETQSLELAKTMQPPIPRISDMRQMKINFGQLVLLLAAEARDGKRPGSTFDPNFTDIAVVTPGTLVELGAKSLSQRQYGGLEIAIFTSVEEALAHARGQ